MVITKMFSYQYQWVDCLCIVQDDQQSIQKHLDGMGYIYSSAGATIVAASGDDANHGLLAVSKTTRRRGLFHEPIDLPGLQFFVMLSHTSWSNRAWTMQEAYFSTRVLICTEMVTWYCPDLLSHECRATNQEFSKASNPQQAERAERA